MLEKEFTDLETKILQEAAVVFCTVSTCGSSKMKGMHFPVGIVDDACQCIEAESLLALELISHRCVLIGDPQQLASVISFAANRLSYERSMMTRMLECKHPVLVLNVQYRMHPNISLFPNKQFYNGAIQDGEPVKHPSHRGKWNDNQLFPPYAFFNITGKEQRDPTSLSIYNELEINAVIHLISNLLRQFPDTKPNQIGIITAHKEQLKRIETQLAKRYPGKKFDLGTIDGYQGRECDIIILSVVRSNAKNEIGVNDCQRLNVAVTRPRYSLWILGNAETLRGSLVWSALIDNAQSRGHLLLKEQHNISVAPVVAVEQAIESVAKAASASTKRAPLFESALWQVFLSNKACAVIKDIIKIGGDVKPLFNKLLWLAQGNRPESSATSLPNSSFSDLICEYRFKNGMIILWTVDIDQYYGLQILKIWEVLPNSVKLFDTIQRIDKSLQTYSREYIGLCQQKIYSDDLIVPFTFDPETISKIFVTTTKNPVLNEAPAQKEVSSVEESFLLMKFFPLSDHMAKMLAVGKQIEVPFKLSPEETDLVVMPMSSIFILGRSGTGKTTVLVFRMLGIQQAYDTPLYNDTIFSSTGEAQKTKTAIKQLFVTASPRLCASISEYYKQLTSAATKDVQSSEEEVSHTHDQMLDEYEVEPVLDATTPQSYADVKDLDHPLIVTFAKLLSMIDNSLQKPFFGANEKRNTWHAEGGRLRGTYASNTRKEVDFIRFSEVYYKHFDQRLCAVVDCAIVYLQIMSFIKGSAEAMATQKGYLSEERYLLLPAKKCPLEPNKRAIVYKMYEKYEQMKNEKKDYDLCDYVFHIIQQLKDIRNSNEFPLMDHIYIDEVQDLTQAQLLVFKYLGNNPKGFVFAGDTAQTITRGVGFRFEDIRSLFYTDFLNFSAAPPDLHCLTQNFRTHSGVCNLASSIIGPILHFFPESIDKLKKETALVEGELPVFLAIEQFEEIFIRMCKNDIAKETGVDPIPSVHMELGAEQAIIVRNAETQKELLSKIPNALVLTVYESKGLEFKSVLLFNFWSDSPAKKAWRSMYKYMADVGLGSPRHFPEFSVERFSALCSELKQLYVGVTRAKQELFIFDDDETTYQPMLDYWVTLEYIKVVSSVNDPMVYITRLAHKSDQETWMNEGKKFFRNRNYELALRCFMNSGNSAIYLLEWTRAAILRAKAEELLKMDKFRAAKFAFIEAAEKFLEVQKLKPSDRKFSSFAATTFIKAEEWERAGNIYMDEREYQKAGDAFIVPKKYAEAANAYFMANMLPEALEACISGHLYQQGKKMVLSFGDSSTPNYCSKEIYKFWRAGALHYHSISDKPRMLDFVKRFVPATEQRRFFTRYGYIEEMVLADLAEGNYAKAAETYFANGKYKEAAEAFKNAQQPRKAAECYLKLALHQETQMQFNRKPNANAKEFIPSKNNNRNTANTSWRPSHSPKFPPTIPIPTSSKPASDATEVILLEAQTLLTDDSSVSFDVKKMLAVKHWRKTGSITSLEQLLSIAREHNRMAAELDILFKILPKHTGDLQYLVSLLLEEGKRARKLCMTFLEGLSANPSQPCPAELLAQIKEYFQVSEHPNPGMVILFRLDWLTSADYQKSVSTPHVFEMREEDFVAKAILHLGRQLTDFMAGIVDRKTKEFEKAKTVEEKIGFVLEGIALAQEALNIFGLTHLRFNETLQNRKWHFDRQLISMLHTFSFFYIPTKRTLRSTLYADHYHKLTELPRKRIEALCVRILVSLHREIDGLCLVLLLDVGNSLQLRIPYYKVQKHLKFYLKDQFYSNLISCSKNGVTYLQMLLHDDNCMAKAGFPLSQAVWMLENLTVYSLAGYTCLHGLVLPKTLVIDCMEERENLFARVAYIKNPPGNGFWFLFEIWEILQKLLGGRFYGWITMFPFEDAVRSYLVERLLQLAFLIRLHHPYFADELSVLLYNFRYNLPTYNVSLPPQWRAVVELQIKAPHEISSCTKFVRMMHVEIGETFCVIKRNNTKKDLRWVSFIPSLIVNANQLSFSGIRSIGVEPQPQEAVVPASIKQVPSKEPENEQEDIETQEPTIEPVPEEKREFTEISQSTKRIALKWLANARAILYNASTLEKYQRTAESILTRMPGASKEYIKFYITNACVLRENLVGGYKELNTKLADLQVLKLTTNKANSTIDEGLDAVEHTQSVLERLDIKNEKHKSFDLPWLQELYEEGRQEIERKNKLVASIEELHYGN